MKILAEGVESIEQVDKLREAKCDIYQGCFYSKPLSENNLKKYLKRKYV